MRCLIATDLTALRAHELMLEQQMEELARSNDELEQFAYVASHDLSEPLRAISGPVSLLAHRYQGQLDDEADALITFAVDGCLRMQSLIDGLLSMSRVGRLQGDFDDVDLNAVMDDVLVRTGADDRGRRRQRDGRATPALASGPDADGAGASEPGGECGEVRRTRGVAAVVVSATRESASGASPFPTTALGFLRPIGNASSGSSSVCTVAPSTPAPASGSPWSRRSSNATRGSPVWRTIPPARVVASGSRCRRHLRRRTQWRSARRDVARRHDRHHAPVQCASSSSRTARRTSS